MNPNTVPERSRETKEKLNDNSSNILLELSKLIKQSNKNSGSQEVLIKSAKLFSNQESSLQSISQNLYTVNTLLKNIESQAILTCQSAEMTGELRDKVDIINRTLKQ
ncbi:hypothetical protein ACHWQZ_G005395 [Mnemiopsis leidyi]